MVADAIGIEPIQSVLETNSPPWNMGACFAGLFPAVICRGLSNFPAVIAVKDCVSAVYSGCQSLLSLSVEFLSLPDFTTRCASLEISVIR